MGSGSWQPSQWVFGRCKRRLTVLLHLRCTFGGTFSVRVPAPPFSSEARPPSGRRERKGSCSRCDSVRRRCASSSTPCRRSRPSRVGRPSAPRTSRSRRPTGTGSPRSSRCRTSPGRSGIVVLPDVRGLYRFYEELALRFAERGFPAVAIDYFGRTAGVGKRDDEFPYMEHVAQTTPDGIQQDTRAAVELLRSPEGGSCASIFTVGFCFGGRNSWLAAAAATVSRARSASTARSRSETATRAPPRGRGVRGPDPRAAGGGRREHPPRAQRGLRGRLEAAGVEHELVVYDGVAAQLLRPPLRGVRRRVGRCLGARARVHRPALPR